MECINPASIFALRRLLIASTVTALKDATVTTPPEAPLSPPPSPRSPPAPTPPVNQRDTILSNKPGFGSVPAALFTNHLLLKFVSFLNKYILKENSGTYSKTLSKLTH